MLPTPAMLHLTSGQWLWAILVLIAAIVGVILYYRRTVPPLRLPIKAPLTIIRIVAAVALFLALADALWSAMATDNRQGLLLILRDHSASMTSQDDSGQSRYVRSQSYLDQYIEPPFVDRANIISMEFDRALYSSEELPDSFGPATALGDALTDIASRLPGDVRPRAAVILSDGAVNKGMDPVAVSGRLGYPLFTIGFGVPGRTRARIVSAETPDIVFSDRPFEIEAGVQSGSDSGSITIRMSVDGQSRDRRTVALTSPGMRVPVTFESRLDTPGIHDLRLDVISSDGTLVPAAGRSLLVNVLKGRLRVALIGCALDWEYTALKRALQNHPRITLISYVIDQPQWDDPMPSGSQWDSIDVAIYLHPSPSELDRYWAPYQASLSRPGHGAVFLLNKRFAPAVGHNSPFPLEMSRFGGDYFEGEYFSSPLVTRQNHPLVRLDPNAAWDDVRRLWERRPPWVGVTVFDTLPPDVDVLVTAPTLGDAPVLWSRPLGRGRAVVLSGTPMWRWVAEKSAAGLPPDQFNAFWQNVIQWLTLSEDTDRLAVRSDRQIYHAGEDIDFEAHVYDEAYRFMEGANVTVRVWNDSAAADTLSLTLNPGSGDRYVTRLTALPAGRFRYAGTAVVGADTLTLAGDAFRVESYGLEQQDTGLDEATLAAIARESGGRYYSEQESPQYLDSLDWTTEQRARTVEFELGQHWSLLAIFIGMLSIEWFVRRRRQML